MIVDPLCCARTGNPCGTDTWAAGSPCDCSCCSRWLAAFREGVEAAALELERIGSRSPSREVQTSLSLYALGVRQLAGDVPSCAVCRQRVGRVDVGAINPSPDGALLLVYRNERNEELVFSVHAPPQTEISMPLRPGAPICGACVRGYASVGMLAPVYVSGPTKPVT